VTTTAIAHPNIALVKYWGKQEKPGNFPATPNLSLTLNGLTSTTTVANATSDAFVLNGSKVEDAKLTGFLHKLRASFEIPPLKIESNNNFPTTAGLASSASGFAALMTAINGHCALNLDAESASEWARMGSASAARSMFGGFVSLVPPTWRAQPLANEDHWPLCIVIAVTSEESKKVGSTEGMQRTAATSPFYKTWVHGAADDYTRANDAIVARDFDALAEVAELNCLKMHSLMLTSVPTLSYWNAATLACIEQVQVLRDKGLHVFFTIDAGPQIKAICTPMDVDNVEAALQQTQGVIKTIRCGIGHGARLKA